MSLIGIKPGDTVFWCSSPGIWEPHPLTVTKVGRKWASVPGERVWQDHWRADIQTGACDGSRFFGRCFLSREQWETETARIKARRDAEKTWGNLRTAMHDLRHWHCPPDLTADTIRQAAALLGIEMETKP